MKKNLTLIYLIILIFSWSNSFALDTDVYQANVKQNAYVLMDNSGSMDFGVYENNIDYGKMYDYLFIKSNIGDTIKYGGYYGDHYEKNKIFLCKGEIGVQITTIDGASEAFTGDAADPDYVWYGNDMVDTHTYIDSYGNLTGEEGETQRLTVDEDGYILFDSEPLPLGQNILLKDYTTLYDGSLINEGFGGLLNAPGYYFSGFEGVGNSADDHNIVEDGDNYIYFFLTGNWMNMQQMYNLHYTSDPGSFADTGDPAWKYEEYPIDNSDWALQEIAPVDYPEGNVRYEDGLSESETVKIISHSGASQIQIYFNFFDVAGDNKVGSFGRDYVALYDENGNLIAQYDNDNSPQGQWSPAISGDTVLIKLKSKNNTPWYRRGYGYIIDKCRTVYGSTNDDAGTYLMQNRLDVAKDAMVYVVDEFRGKINWGFATFSYTGYGSGDGATINSALNPNDTDDANRAAIIEHIEGVTPKYGTPLGEALQDVFYKGYYGHRNSLDNLICRRNYTIVVSDGYPSNDEDNNRFGVAFDDWDGDGFTQDPYQYDNPSEDYYDDIANWIYTHSWMQTGYPEVEDPANSYENIIPHQIAFGAKHPLMRDAAEESGAEYITAYNKEQLVNAFHSLGLMISQAVSFKSPVVSINTDNKIENGDDIYMGLFLPKDSEVWPGNIKHFQFGDGTSESSETWTIYDAAGDVAQDSDGDYFDNTNGYWGDDTDGNDSNNNNAAEIEEDGVGEVLTERVRANFSSAPYERNIKTYLDDTLVDFSKDTISLSHLGLSDDSEVSVSQVINWVYGFTFDADETTGEPIAPRDWALGAIIHSSPTILDYYSGSGLEARYIAIGADDGMLHIFEDSDSGGNPTGTEVFAFIPDDVLTKLPLYSNSLHESMVDGELKIFSENGNPKYLFFGLRRGGNSFWRLDISSPDPADWTNVEKFTDNEMGQSWSGISFAKIRTGEDDYIDVAIVSGGYDEYEDSFPEPFNDTSDYRGTPFKDNGDIDNSKWSSGDSTQDVYDNNQYDIYNPSGDNIGRAIYIFNVETMEKVFSVEYDSTNDPPVNVPDELGSFSSETTQYRNDFIYCFPATPSVAVHSEVINNVRQYNLLSAIYASDIYGNIFRINYDYADGSKLWQVKHIFSANPSYDNASGTITGSANSSDVGRKVFYGPAVSWKGSGNYFDQYNYKFPSVEFDGTGSIATLFFGTGDRAHPNYKIVRNRIYAIYDDSSVTASDSNLNNINVNGTPYTESDLLNITCDELGVDTTQTSGDTSLYKQSLQYILYDDVLNTAEDELMELALGGNGENDAKGWYIILDVQGDPTYCSHCDYEATVDNSEDGRDNHFGEKILSKFLLYNGNLYFTSYQPSYDDPCAPQGNGFNYALNYLDGSAALNLNAGNDSTDPEDTEPIKKDVTDRYGKLFGIKQIPSSPVVVFRQGDDRIISNTGPPTDPPTDKTIDLYYWIEQ